MSVLLYGMNYIHRHVDSKLLKMAFKDKADILGIDRSLDKQILDLLVEPIIKVDINLTGGMMIDVPLRNCNMKTYTHSNNEVHTIVDIPNHLVNNRPIISILGIDSRYNGISSNRMSQLEMNVGALDIQRSKLAGSVTYTKYELLSSNTILIFDNVDTHCDVHIKLNIGNTDSLSNIDNVSSMAFGELMLLGVEMFIYNRLNIDLAEGSLYYGHEISKYADLIDSYSASKEKYYEYLKTTWSKIAFMNDKKSNSKFYEDMVGFGL